MFEEVCVKREREREIILAFYTCEDDPGSACEFY